MKTKEEGRQKYCKRGITFKVLYFQTDQEELPSLPPQLCSKDKSSSQTKQHARAV
jgi:hypothetical protein